ncbi:hypothetical protein B0H13DRAFT_1895817 [Mycena leptocephala]|nr:hypothetical protein B0H13DRAFT_1895817 [Mycena leptocephala]
MYSSTTYGRNSNLFACDGILYPSDGGESHMVSKLLTELKAAEPSPGLDMYTIIIFDPLNLGAESGIHFEDMDEHDPFDLEEVIAYIREGRGLKPKSDPSPGLEFCPTLDPGLGPGRYMYRIQLNWMKKYYFKIHVVDARFNYNKGDCRSRNVTRNLVWAVRLDKKPLPMPHIANIPQCSRSRSETYVIEENHLPEAKQDCKYFLMGDH